MRHFLKFRKSFIAAVLTASLSGFCGSSAQAGELPHSRFQQHYGPISSGYVQVVEYEFQIESYTEFVTEIDECGLEQKVPRVRQRTIRVPVKRWVKVVNVLNLS